MTDRLQIAQDTARIILDSSYRSESRDSGVDDVMLFGSTLTGSRYRTKPQDKDGDIDLLVLHNTANLWEYGWFTTYDPEEHIMVRDLEADVIEERHTPSRILESMSCRDIEDMHWAFTQVLDDYREQTRYRSWLEYEAADTLDLIHIGELEITPGDFMKRYKQVRKAFEDRVESKTVYSQVAQQLGESIDDTLDIIVMNKILLDTEKSNDKFQELRALAVKQSRDPTFWRSILHEGRLYNRDSGTFDLEIEEKYPGCLGLLDPDSLDLDREFSIYVV